MYDKCFLSEMRKKSKRFICIIPKNEINGVEKVWQLKLR